ncbi:MAG: type III-A CRISPR-associated RAMP protein Csm4 [Halanaerobiales bacterium]|nr:type III-A CRISPR-associated RAMP protein Csm4 [Halanaerobiales bacterium]
MSRIKGIKFVLPEHAKFHFGDPRGNIKKIFSSDQLFSALINCAALLYPIKKIEELIALFAKEQFSISSLYYGLDFFEHGNNRALTSFFFMPKPYWLIRSSQQENQEVDEVRLRKKLKKVEFISTKAYESILNSWNGEFFDYNLFSLPTIGNTFAFSEEELLELKIKKEQLVNQKFISAQSYQKLQVDRMTIKSDNTYYENNIEISPMKVGKYVIKPFMYCMCRGLITKEILAALRILVEEGIGGKRSRGLGYFVDVKQIEVPIKDSIQGKYYLSLSTIFPKVDEVENIMSYKLSERSGYIYAGRGQGVRRRSLRVVDEGSIFSNKIKGQIKDVTPKDSNLPHSVLLNGKAFLLGFGGNDL